MVGCCVSYKSRWEHYSLYIEHFIFIEMTVIKILKIRVTHETVTEIAHALQHFTGHKNPREKPLFRQRGTQSIHDDAMKLLLILLYVLFFFFLSVQQTECVTQLNIWQIKDIRNTYFYFSYNFRFSLSSLTFYHAKELNSSVNWNSNLLCRFLCVNSRDRSID